MVKKDKDVFMTTEITNIEIYKLLKDTHKQTVKTNGRVSVLEKKSLGLWFSNHPFKFALAFMMFTVIVISDLRHPLVEFIMKMFI